MNFKAKLKVAFCVVISFCICVMAIFCMSEHMMDFQTGSVKVKVSEKYGANTSLSANQKAKSNNKNNSKNTKSMPSNIGDVNENMYPIKEVDLSDGYIDYDNFSVNNSTDYSLDIADILDDKLGFEIEDNRQVQVLIVHTHTCESYMSEDSTQYPESFYPRTTDNNKNVCAVGKTIANKLKENGIGVIHADIQHDSPSYDGAYGRSYDTISRYLEKYKSIKVVLDIHRDSMTQQDNTKLKPTFEYNGKKGAQVMIMAGYDSTSQSFPTWKENLTFALKLQSKCASMYKGMMRPLNFGNFTYNMNANNGSLLIEVGTDANSLDEALYSADLLGNALSEVLQNA